MSSAPPHDPVDFPEFPPMDETGTVDLFQIDYNLSLTPAQRIEQYLQFLEFVIDVRESTIRRLGMDPRPPEIFD